MKKKILQQIFNILSEISFGFGLILGYLSVMFCTKSGILQTGEGGGSWAPPDPDFLHVKKYPDFRGNGQVPHELEIQILFW